MSGEWTVNCSAFTPHRCAFCAGVANVPAGLRLESQTDEDWWQSWLADCRHLVQRARSMNLSLFFNHSLFCALTLRGQTFLWALSKLSSPIQFFSPAITSCRPFPPLAPPVICKVTSTQARIKDDSIRAQILPVPYKLESWLFSAPFRFHGSFEMAHRGERLLSVCLLVMALTL